MRHLYLTLEGRDMEAAVQAMWECAPRPASRWYRQAACVWLSGKIARPFVFGPVQGLKGWREAHDAAAALAPSACGLEGSCVASLESDPGASATLATAVEGRLIEALERGAHEHRYRLVSVRPAWALACEPSGRPSVGDVELLCVRESDALTVLGGTATQTVFAATYEPPTSEADLDGLLRRVTASVAVDPMRLAVARLSADQPAGKPRLHWHVDLGRQGG